MSYVMMKYLNLTQHAIVRYQGLLMRKYFIYIHIIQLVSQRIDEEAQLESVFYTTKQDPNQGQA